MSAPLRERWPASAWARRQRAGSPFPRAFLAMDAADPAGISVSYGPEEGTLAEEAAASGVEEVSRLRRRLAEREDEVARLTAALAERDEQLSQLLAAASADVQEPNVEEPSTDNDGAESCWPDTARLAAVVDTLGHTLGVDIALVRHLGSGKFAEVVLAEVGGTGQRVAVKIAEDDVDRGLLATESGNIARLAALPGSDAHIVSQLHRYVELHVELGPGVSFSAGAVVLELADGDLESWVRAVLGPEGSGLEAVAPALARWERSLMWLHAQGCLHLDIKAENAVYFGSAAEGAIKLIDLSGLIMRHHIPGVPDDVPNEQLVWDTADLQRAGLAYVCTDDYCQPMEMGLGGRLLDYSIDWWSVGVSKLELLRAAPNFFDEEADTPQLVMEALKSGQLEVALRARLAALLGTNDVDAPQVSHWAKSVITNLHGKAAPLL